MLDWQRNRIDLDLGDHGIRVFVATSVGEARSILDNHHDISLVILEILFPHNKEGVELARQIRESRPGTQILFYTQRAERSVLQEAAATADAVTQQQIDDPLPWALHLLGPEQHARPADPVWTQQRLWTPANGNNPESEDDCYEFEDFGLDDEETAG
jgi:CheY-like chemotaxis protein